MFPRLNVISQHIIHSRKLLLSRAVFPLKVCNMADFSIKRVLISDKIDPVCKKVFEENHIQADLRPGLSKEELIDTIKDYDCLVVRSATKVTPDVIAAGQKLKLVGRAGTGVDNIDLDAATKNGVLVMNTPGGNTMSAAEHTCAMIFSLARHIPQGYLSMQEGKWERSKFMGCELKGKTLAIIGLGRIGREVALRMQACEMKTIGYDPLVSKEAAAEFGVEFLELEQLWPLADFVTVHTPLIPQTKGMINSKTFEVCKDSIRLINVARGGIIDETDLLQALRAGKCAGAALDVFVNEPPSGITSELIKHPLVICTPHLGASTLEAQVRVAKEIAEQIVDASNGKTAVGLVNAPAIAEAGKEDVKPWITLGESLGAVLAQLGDDLIKKVRLQTRGEKPQGISEALLSAVACGLVKRKGSKVNLLNGTSLAKEMGIEITLSIEPISNCCYSSCLFLTCENSSVQVGGTVFDNKAVLTNCFNVMLSNPVSLPQHLTVAVGKESEKLALIQKILGSALSLTSFSVACDAGKCVLVASKLSVGEESLGKEFRNVTM